MELKYKSKESSEQVESEMHSENIQKWTKIRKNHGRTTKPPKEPTENASCDLEQGWG